MTNDPSTLNPGGAPKTPASPPATFNNRKLALMIRQLKEPKRNELRDVDQKHATIMIYIYRNEKLTMKQLRSMMKLSEITSYRYGSRLTELGLIKWKGSHKNGAYFITEKGKEFVEKNG
jgi:predicted HTH transcriptional regulator